MQPEGGFGERASILVMISPAHAELAAGQTIALTAITDDRLGVTWSVSPSAGTIAPSSSYNQAAVIFTAPQKPGIYTATATSMTNPSRSRSAIIIVTLRHAIGSARSQPPLQLQVTPR